MDELDALGEQLEPKTMFEWMLGVLLVSLIDYFDDPDSFEDEELEMFLEAADETAEHWKAKYHEEIQAVMDRHG